MNILEEYFGKIIDVHTHLFPEKIAAKATQAVGDFYGIPMDNVGTSENLKKDMRDYGISHCFIHSVATVPKQVRNINDFLIEVMQNDYCNYTAFGTLHVGMENMTDELDYMRANGIIGLKLHNDFQGFAVDDRRLDDVYEKCQAEKIPVMFHAGDKRYEYTNPRRFVNVAKRFPELIGIAAHFGGYSEWVDVDDDYCRDTNFWFDTSSSLSFMDKCEAHRIIKTRGDDKIMFGTDFPMWRGADEYLRLEELELGRETVEKILFKNAEAFLSLVIK